MYLGSALALIAVGLILALAVDFQVAGIDIKMIGWILAIIGVIGAILDLAVFRQRSNTTGTTREVVRERDTY